jgi:hypothetical protein
MHGRTDLLEHTPETIADRQLVLAATDSSTAHLAHKSFDSPTSNTIHATRTRALSRHSHDSWPATTASPTIVI